MPLETTAPKAPSVAMPSGLDQYQDRRLIPLDFEIAVHLADFLLGALALTPHVLLDLLSEIPIHQ